MTTKPFALDREALRGQFDQRTSLYDALRQEALFAFETALAADGIKYHSIPSRVKSFESFVDKVARKEFDHPFEQVTDIVGLRAVALFLPDITRIGDVVRKTFDVVSEDNKIEDQAASSFGYLSVHFIARMKTAYAGPRYDLLGGMLFEIQVRTIAMDAWANASHYLEYKTESDIPKELKRDFYALSGLFYVADTHFQMLFKAREESRKQLTRNFANNADALNEPINLDTMNAYLIAKFPDRVHVEEKNISDLVQELTAAGYTGIREIDEGINKTAEAFKKYEADHPPYSGSRNKPQVGRRYADVGVVRLSFSILNPKFSKARDPAEYAEYRAMLMNDKK